MKYLLTITSVISLALLSACPNNNSRQPRLLGIEGSIHKDGTVDLSPWFIFNSTNFQASEKGEYSVQSFDAQGALIEKHNFDVNFIRIHTNGVDSAPFDNVVMNYHANAHIFRIFKGEQLLKEVKASNHDPILTSIKVPTGNELRGKQTISWSAIDLDGDKPLHFRVFYTDTPDAEHKIHLLRADITDTSIEVDFDTIPGGKHWFLIEVSDGLRSTEKLSTPVTIALKPPRVDIHHPTSNETIVHKKAGKIILDGTGYDNNLQKTIKDPMMLEWTVDGAVLGNGFTLKLDEDHLGYNQDHTVTLKVTDSKGLTSSRDVVFHFKESE